MTTDGLANAIAFAAAEKHEGDIRQILAQALAACRTLLREIGRQRDALDGIENALQASLDESCDANTQHCTCVPLLRQEVHRLRARVAELEQASPPICEFA